MCRDSRCDDAADGAEGYDVAACYGAGCGTGRVWWGREVSDGVGFVSVETYCSWPK